MAGIATAEACGPSAPLLSSGDLRVLQPVFSIYGQTRMFSGPIVTLKVFEDNVLARELLETKGEGRVLVVDGAGSMRCALVGNEKEETGEGGEEVAAVDEPSSMSGIFVFNPEIFIGR